MNEIENVFTSTVIQSRMSAVWFKDKELAFSFGCILAFSRLVSYKTNDYCFYMQYQHSLTTDGFVRLCIFGPLKKIVSFISGKCVELLSDRKL